MKDGSKNIIAATIITLGLIISMIIYAFSTRYVIVDDTYPKRCDKWTGNYEYMKDK